jgi:hypothetical protein
MRLLHQMNHIYFLEVGYDRITQVFRENALVKTKMRTKSSLKILEPKSIPNRYISTLFLSQKSKTLYFSSRKNNLAKKDAFTNATDSRCGIKHYYNAARGVYRVDFLKKNLP